jgi:predicted DCC family thiol-disulfide oxidoreductase YuxK
MTEDDLEKSRQRAAVPSEHAKRADGEQSKEVWLVYDGECPICKPTANAFKIKQAVGELHIVNAREDHPIMQELKERGLDIDKGMVLKMDGNYYQGAEALNICAMIGTDSDFFNKLNVKLFRSKCLSKIAYPVFMKVRNLALCCKRIGKVDNLNRK